LLIGIGTDDHVKMFVANSFPPLPRQRSRDTLASQRFRHRAI
jgi:hypothetical protein